MLLATAACALLTSAEISAVQGEAPVRTKPSASDTPGLSVERCFFELPSFPKSISLEITRGVGVRALWQRSFHAHAATGGEDEEKDRAAPLRLRGLGEEAFWAGNPRLGGLYVLRRNVILRLAVGEAETVAGKLRKLRRLAGKALARM